MSYCICILSQHLHTEIGNIDSTPDISSGTYCFSVLKFTLSVSFITLNILETQCIVGGEHLMLYWFEKFEIKIYCCLKKNLFVNSRLLCFKKVHDCK